MSGAGGAGVSGVSWALGAWGEGDSVEWALQEAHAVEAMQLGSALWWEKSLYVLWDLKHHSLKLKMCGESTDDMLQGWDVGLLPGKHQEPSYMTWR
jgi:hypothetical protein